MRPQFQENDYLAITQSGHGEAYCERCKDFTEFSLDEYGEVFCTSCGNEPEPYPEAEAEHHTAE